MSGEILDPRRRQTIQELSGGDNALLLELLEKFLEVSRRELDEMRHSLEKNEIMRRILHSLKGMAANLGLAEFFAVLEEIHEIARRGERIPERYVDRLEKCRIRVEEVLQGIRREGEASSS